MTFLGLLSDPFQWLSDLQLGDEKVTLNHLVVKIEVKPQKIVGISRFRNPEIQLRAAFGVRCL